MQPAKNDGLIRAYLLHLSYNMWGDREVPGADLPYYAYNPHGSGECCSPVIAFHGVKSKAVRDLYLS